MGWISRYGKWQDDLAPPKPQPIRFKHVVAGFIPLVLLGSCLACFPLTVILVPKPQLTEYMPKGIYCATCEEIWQHNRDLFNRDDMLCYGPPARVGVHTGQRDAADSAEIQDHPTSKEEEVMFTEEKRCWVIKKGHDIWMRPLQVTDEETKNWKRGVQTRA